MLGIIRRNSTVCRVAAYSTLDEPKITPTGTPTTTTIPSPTAHAPTEARTPSHNRDVCTSLASELTIAPGAGIELGSTPTRASTSHTASTATTTSAGSATVTSGPPQTRPRRRTPADHSRYSHLIPTPGHFLLQALNSTSHQLTK